MILSFQTWTYKRIKPYGIPHSLKKQLTEMEIIIDKNPAWFDDKIKAMRMRFYSKKSMNLASNYY